MEYNMIYKTNATDTRETLTRAILHALAARPDITGYKPFYGDAMFYGFQNDLKKHFKEMEMKALTDALRWEPEYTGEGVKYYDAEVYLEDGRLKAMYHGKFQVDPYADFDDPDRSGYWHDGRSWNGDEFKDKPWSCRIRFTAAYLAHSLLRV